MSTSSYKEKVEQETEAERMAEMLELYNEFNAEATDNYIVLPDEEKRKINEDWEYILNKIDERLSYYTKPMDAYQFKFELLSLIIQYGEIRELLNPMTEVYIGDKGKYIEGIVCRHIKEKLPNEERFNKCRTFNDLFTLIGEIAEKHIDKVILKAAEEINDYQIKMNNLKIINSTDVLNLNKLRASAKLKYPKYFNLIEPVAFDIVSYKHTGLSNKMIETIIDLEKKGVKSYSRLEFMTHIAEKYESYILEVQPQRSIPNVDLLESSTTSGKKKLVIKQMKIIRKYCAERGKCTNCLESGHSIDECDVIDGIGYTLDRDRFLKRQKKINESSL